MKKHQLFLQVLLLIGTGAFAQTAPSSAEISGVTLNGSGCDMDNVAVSLSPDFKDISLLFDDYVSDIGQGSRNANRLELTKNCEVQIHMNIPDGWQMAFRAVDYRGFVLLPHVGSSAFHRFSILQEGAPIVSMREASVVGPFNDDYYVRSEVRPERLTWSKCLSGSTKVRLVSQLGVRLNPRSSDRSLAQISLDSADASIQQNLTVEWRRCSGSAPGRPGNPGSGAPGRPGRSERPERPDRYVGR